MTVLNKKIAHGTGSNIIPIHGMEPIDWVWTVAYSTSLCATIRCFQLNSSCCMLHEIMISFLNSIQFKYGTPSNVSSRLTQGDRKEIVPDSHGPAAHKALEFSIATVSPVCKLIGMNERT